MANGCGISFTINTQMKSPEETPQLQFLQSIDYGGKDHAGVEYQDIHLSDYNHEKVRQLPNVSQKRWVQGINLKLWPGSGSGQIVINGETFDVDYAWGGRNTPTYTSTGDRTSYTVRLKGEGVQARIAKVRDAIIQDESGALTYEMSYRDHQKQVNKTNTREEGIKKTREALKAMRELVGSGMDFITKEQKAATTKKWLDGFRKAWDENKPVVLHYQMKTIETDTLK
jgi:hypothetical protein